MTSDSYVAAEGDAEEISSPTNVCKLYNICCSFVVDCVFYS